jgi:hypothetical protein
LLLTLTVHGGGLCQSSRCQTVLRRGVAGQTVSTTRRLERQIAKGSDELPPQRKERGTALHSNCAKTVLLAATYDTTGARGRVRAQVEISANNPANCGIRERHSLRLGDPRTRLKRRDPIREGTADRSRSRAAHRFAPVPGSRGGGNQQPARATRAGPPARLPSPWPLREWTSRPHGSGSRAARGLVVGGGVDWRERQHRSARNAHTAHIPQVSS